jgi:hypothetical protein
VDQGEMMDGRRAEKREEAGVVGLICDILGRCNHRLRSIIPRVYDVVMLRGHFGVDQSGFACEGSSPRTRRS